MKSGFSLALSLWLALIASNACGAPPQAAEDSDSQGSAEGSFERLEGDTAKAVGVVSANEQLCVVDAQCWLVVDVGEMEIKVIYVEAEGVVTVNDKAADAGFAAKPSDVVEVYGAHEKSGTGHVISTCAREDFYLRTRQPPPS